MWKAWPSTGMWHGNRCCGVAIWRWIMIGLTITFAILGYVVNSCVHNARMVRSCKIWHKAEFRLIRQTILYHSELNWTDTSYAIWIELYHRPSLNEARLFLVQWQGDWTRKYSWLESDLKKTYADWSGASHPDMPRKRPDQDHSGQSSPGAHSIPYRAPDSPAPRCWKNRLALKRRIGDCFCWWGSLPLLPDVPLGIEYVLWFLWHPKNIIGVKFVHPG